MTSERKVISIANENEDVISRTITNTGGGVLVRIGTHDNETISSGSTNERNRVTDVNDARQRQLAKNAAYRQSSTRQFIDNNNEDMGSEDSGHMIYTKVASAKQQTGSQNSRTKSFITRKITKGRLSENHQVQNGDVNHVAPSVAESSSDRPDGSQDFIDPANRKKLNYKEDGSIKNLPKDACFCCRKTVYQKEKIGPIRDVLYHKQCFRCSVCGFVLNLTNFNHNSNDLEDKGLYCKSHEPVAETARVSILDKTIQSVINKPKLEQLNPNIRGGAEAAKIRTIDAEAVSIKGAIKAPTLDKYNPIVRVNQESPTAPRPAHNEVHIKAAMTSPEPEVNGYRTSTGTLISNQGGHLTVGVKTALNAPKVAIYNSTVRPVPAMVKTAPPPLYRSPTEYKSRQIQSPDFTTTPTPPSPPQHVHFNGNTKTYYYINRK